jgi:glycosyltransferase involved in cell wall biosynthesis
MAGVILNQIFVIKKQFSFDHVLFLNLNLVIRHSKILNPFIKLPFTFSGVILNSPYRLRKHKRNKITLAKREIPIRLLFKNRNCTKIFLFNDDKGVKFYKKWSSKVEYINEAVRIALPSNLNVINYHGVNTNDLIFIQIGKLAAYKGTIDILRAISNLNEKVIQNSHFLFVGTINKDTKTEFAKMANSGIENKISTRDEFITENDFTSYILQSHVVIIANKNVENSSGIVCHCLANNKVVIAPNNGFFKEVLEDYGAAILFDVNFTLKDAIEKAFMDFNSLQSTEFDTDSYIKNNSSEKYAETLLQSLY